jgi:hypothetical protein
MNKPRAAMRIFPSISASVVTGAVVLPLCITGINFLASALQPGILLLASQILWGTLTLFIPVAVATMDMRRVRDRQRQLGGDIFTPLAGRQDFREIYVPAWLRMGALFFSALVSLLILQRLGLHI